MLRGPLLANVPPRTVLEREASGAREEAEGGTEVGDSERVELPLHDLEGRRVRCGELRVLGRHLGRVRDGVGGRGRGRGRGRVRVRRRAWGSVKAPNPPLGP